MMAGEGILPLDLSSFAGTVVTVSFTMRAGLTLYGARLA